MSDISNSIAEGVRKAFLAGVGAVALGAEKSTELIDEFVKKGEITVEQGKDLNRELTVKAKVAIDDAQDTVLRTRLASMTPQERADFIDRARKVSSDLTAKEAAESGTSEDDSSNKDDEE